MATTLSEEDFQRLQTQLLELRTKNYVLEERNFKYSNEMRQLLQNCEELRHELNKAQKTIQRSKYARDFEHILQENDRLQSKLQSQEDEFRLQNETLMQEVIALTSANDKFQKEMEMYKSEKHMSSEAETNDEIMRYESENNALKKLLQKCSCDSQRSSADVNGLSEDAVELDEEMKNRLNAETDLEEKSLLKAKISEIQKVLQEKTLHFQSEMDKANEKLKKKQESLLQLHEEKEKLFTESKISIKALEEEKNIEICRLNEELKIMGSQMKALSNDNVTPNLNSPDATVELIDGEKASFECSTSESKAQLMREYEAKVQNLNNMITDLESTVLQIRNEKGTLEEENSVLRKEKLSLEEMKNEMEAIIAEKSNLAEERKVLMEKMNVHLLETNSKHSKEIENLTTQLSQEQESLQKLFNKEKETRIELLDTQNDLKNLRKELEQIKNDHNTNSKELEDAVKAIEDEKAVLQEKLDEQNAALEDSVKEWEEKLRNCEKDFNIQIEVARAEKCEFEEKVGTYQQEIKDLLDEKKIIEKKNAGLVKDLKRQLLSERRRAEKLQERLQELMNEQNCSIDDILPSSSSAEKPKGDASSVSSWSYVSAEAADRENCENPSHSDGSSCERDSPGHQSQSTLENETTNLLAKVTYLQQRNWVLEEKVSHLEMSNEALVDDLLKKTAIIQYYCMEGRSNAHAAGAQDKLTIKRIVDFIKDKGDENLREINRKMQRMLEETLTKNMHLQKDIETLSNEVSRLSKLSQPSEN